MIKLNARELRTTNPTNNQLKQIVRRQIYLILDNVLDTYNVGSIFRLADAIGAAKIFLCGETLTPPNPRIKKASISTWKWVKWEYFSTALTAIQYLRNKVPNAKIVAVEQDQKSIPFNQMKYDLPLVVVVGNETYGISQDVLQKCDAIVELPMYGVNKSLNVMVSLGIVLYEIDKYLNQDNK